MKKFLSLLLPLVALVTVAATAQSTTPRFGITPNNDNTARTLTYKWVTKTDATGADSLKFTPNAWTNIVRLSSVTDSLAVVISSTAYSYAGDNIQIIASGTSGGFVKFVGSNMITAGKATLSTSGRAVINLVFDGSKYVEASRVVQ